MSKITKVLRGWWRWHGCRPELARLSRIIAVDDPLRLFTFYYPPPPPPPPLQTSRLTLSPQLCLFRFAVISLYSSPAMFCSLTLESVTTISHPWQMMIKSESVHCGIFAPRLIVFVDAALSELELRPSVRPSDENTSLPAMLHCQGFWWINLTLSYFIALCTVS